MGRPRIIFGLAVIAIIIGSGFLLSFFLLREQSTQISPADWQRLNVTLASLVANQSSQPVSVTASQAIPLTNQLAINTASAVELDQLPGIGQIRAKALVDERSAHGPYRDLDDIRARVPQIPASILQKISPQITFDQ